jgi:hypothetical protein
MIDDARLDDVRSDEVDKMIDYSAEASEDFGARNPLTTISEE